MKVRTKEILKSCLAFVMVLCVALTGLPLNHVKASGTSSGSDFKAAILSDIHVGFDYQDGNADAQKNWVKYVLKWYKNQGVDAVIIPGDIVNGYAGSSLTLEQSKSDWADFVSVWNEVFPEEKDTTGYVEPIIIYGNHDKKLSGADGAGELTDSEINELWRQVNEEDFSPVYSKEVGGYWFVGVHESMEKANAALLQEKLDEAVAQSGGKPVFYIQHAPMYQTTAFSDGPFYGDEETGYNAAKNYENVIALTGHTHIPITDERAIWQGDIWEEGKFTSISCGTLNYSGTLENGRVNGNGQDTKQGLLMTVNGNDIEIERYNFNTEEMKGLVAGTDTEQEFATCTTSAGADWSFTVGGEKPYTYDKRKAESTAPEFGVGATAEVTTTDTTATLTFPKAIYESLFESYVVEARDVRSGVIKATGMINTEYHIDAGVARYADSYSVTVSGLKEDAEYNFYVYARNFFGKCSTKPLKVTGKTTGVRTSGEQGDVNGDLYTDARDLVAFKKAGESANMDVDENGEKNSAEDIKALYRILLGYASAVVDSANDLVGQSTYQNINVDTSCQGYGHQTKVVNTGNANVTDSKKAFEVWAIEKSSSNPYPWVTLLFDEAQDWSQSNILNFDTKFVDKANKKWYEIRLVSGEHNIYSSAQNINADSMEWSTKSIPLKEFTNVDWSNVKGVRFLLNFDYYEGRFDGTTKSSFFVDNMYPSYEMIPDNDLLSHYKSGITATNGAVSIVTGDKVATASVNSCEAHKLVLNGETASVDIPFAGNPSRLDTLSIATKLSQGTLTVQAYGKDGNVVGTAKTLQNKANQWTVNTITSSEIGYSATVAGYRFTVTGSAAGETLLLDDFTATYKECGTDTDYFATGSVAGTNFTANKINWEMQPYTTNGSAAAIHAWSDSTEADDWPHIKVTLPQAIDLTDLEYLSYDIKFGGNTKAWSSCTLYGEDGTKIAEKGMDPAAGEDPLQWNTKKLVPSTINGKVKKIDLCVYLGKGYGGAGYLQDIWIDNLNIILKETDDLLATDNMSWTSSNFSMNNPACGMLQIQNGFTNDSSQAVRISTEAETITSNKYPWFIVELPSDATVNENTSVSIDGWFSDNFYPWIEMDLLDKNGSKIAVGGMNFKANNVFVHNQWLTVNSAVSGWEISSGKQLSDGAKIKIILNLDSANGTAREMYLDNFKLINPKRDSDMLSQVTRVTISKWCDPGQLTVSKVEEGLAHGSYQAWSMTYVEGSENYPFAQFEGPNGYWNMSAADSLQMDIKFEGGVQSAYIRLQYIDDDGNWKTTPTEKALSLTPYGDGWNSGTVKLSEFEKSDKSDKLSQAELGRVRAVEIMLHGAKDKTGTIYLDNMKLVTNE